MTKIQWTDEVWNPTVGCSRVSAGCQNCYAERVAHRGMTESHRGLTVMGAKGPRWTGDVRLMPSRLGVPRRWRKPRRVFVNSMSDLFHPEVPFEFVAAVFNTMAACPQHTFQVLTKRPKRAEEFFWWTDDHESPLPNVWLGVSVEDQATADERLPILQGLPGVVRWASYEPALGPVRFLAYPWLSWVVVGGESGPRARPFDVAWARAVIADAHSITMRNMPVFVKQLGGVVKWGGTQGGYGSGPSNYWPRGSHYADYGDGTWTMRLKDRKGGDPSEWPEDIRVREFPEVEA
ncbi:MAG: phage Gp37/Gp68 family protein [Myxococcota bacterium]